MQRKIYQYWRRKERSKETLNATASKVQINVSDVGAQTIAQSVTPNQRNKNKPLFRLDGQRSMSLLTVAQERPSYDHCAKKSASTKTLKHIKKLSIFLK